LRCARVRRGERQRLSLRELLPNPRQGFVRKPGTGLMQRAGQPLQLGRIV